ncbi:Vacuolar protein sorting-associated protein 37A [Lobulomyces angularis]|nr:Vacuolar protein sorting-associated protein 37A [Lobulomyces angularis]
MRSRGRLIDVVDDEWRKDKLESGDIEINVKEEYLLPEEKEDDWSLVNKIDTDWIDLELKNKQISTLFKEIPTLEQIELNSSYKVKLKNSHFYLVISLPTNFPQSSPILSLNPSQTAFHEMIDQCGHIKSQKLNNGWRQHYSLGKTCAEILTLLNQNPPTLNISLQQQIAIETNNPANNRSTPPPIPLKQFQSSPISQPQSQPYQLFQYDFLTDLRKKTIEELEELILDDNAFKVYFNDITQVKNLKFSRDEIQIQNETLSKENLEKEENLTRIKNNMLSLMEEYSIARAEYASVFDELLKAQERFSNDSMISILKKHIETYESSSELLQAKYFELKDSNLNADDFLKSFLEDRKNFHLYTSKLDNFKN